MHGVRCLVTVGRIALVLAAAAIVLTAGAYIARLGGWVGPGGVAQAVRGLARAPVPQHPNILLISIDTLRADHLSVYGSPIDTSPTLVGLARTGTVFSNAYSTSSWTTPAVVSMLTSVLPTRHGVNHGIVKDDRALVGQEVITNDLPILAEVLHQREYQTFGVAANVHLDGAFGFARGFDHYDCPGFVGAARVLETVRTWKAKIAPDKPYFAWIHFFDPHEPYVPREPWMTQFLAGRPRHPELENVPSARRFEKMNLSDELVDYVKLLYDSEIRFTDDYVGRVLAELGATENDFVIVVSDHGEEFGEHGLFAHGQSLYEASVRIPLIMRFPGERFANVTVSETVSIMDVFPTILEVAGLPAIPALQGTSVIPALSGEAKESRPIILHLSRDVELRAIVTEGWKLIYPQRSSPRSALRPSSGSR